MNLIGHNYIAKEVLSKYNPQIAAGAHIPDLVPFLSTSVFSFNEVHENPDAVYQSCLANNKEYIDVALGMMTHSVKYGADKYSGDIGSWLVGENSELLGDIAQRIVECSKVSLETAKVGRMHNYLWAGMDFHIIDRFPEFTKEIQKTYAKIDIKSVSKILSETYKKDLAGVESNLREHLGLVSKHDVTSQVGCIAYWKDFLSQLPEKDDIDVEKATACVNFVYKKFENQWQEIIDRVTKGIKIRMSEFII